MLEHADFTHPFDFAEWTPAHWAISVVLWLLFLWLSLHIPFTLLRLRTLKPLPPRYRSPFTGWRYRGGFVMPG